MAVVHTCIQTDKIAQLASQADRVEKEVYVGREGRQPVTVRLDRVERVINKLVYVSTALLIAAVTGLGATILRMAAAWTSGEVAP